MVETLRTAFFSLGIFCGCVLFTAVAADLAAPPGKVILKVSGSIEATNTGAHAVFDLNLLEETGLTEVTTETPWTDGKVTFQGVLLRDFVARLGATGKTMTATAFDDYSIEIPLSDFDQYDAILATRREGEPMRIRDKGPVWVIYPWSEHPELQNEKNYAKAIWQVRELVFK